MVEESNLILMEIGDGGGIWSGLVERIRILERFGGCFGGADR